MFVTLYLQWYSVSHSCVHSLNNFWSFNFLKNKKDSQSHAQGHYIRWMLTDVGWTPAIKVKGPRLQAVFSHRHHEMWHFIESEERRGKKTKGKPRGWIRINTPFIWLINRSDYTNANTELWNNRTNQRDNDCTFVVWPSLVLTPLAHPPHCP